MTEPVEQIDTQVPNRKKYRNYQLKTEVARHYLENHKQQTYEYVKKTKSEILPLRKGKYDVFSIIKLMDEIIDESDTDNKKPQIIHALQTGEACRKAMPDQDWFHLVKFIHDLGKVIAHPSLYNLPQWAVVGDTFPVGCPFYEKLIFNEFFEENPDSKNEHYSSVTGIYNKECGFDSMEFSFGHDEYMYLVLVASENSLPEEALYVIRFHSFYAWHQNKGYDEFASEKDKKLFELLRKFQKCDLFSKKEEIVDVKELITYYENLLRKYFPNTELIW